jgi:eukaryotic-like serine/threonine-protein kinase
VKDHPDHGMKSERWQQIEELYHAALAQDDARRAAFVADACRNDEDLRREVESLLAAGSSDDGRLDSPAWDGAASLLEDPRTEELLSAGHMLGPYEILAPLGRGGMGDVYRALDRKLNREVAVKILPKAFARHPGRVERLKREARVLATLNHPNIAAVYDLQELEGHCFLVLELVPGKTLSRKLSRGALPARESLSICRQVAEALEAAHEKGVIHRDLKPGNIMVTPEGRVKLLDFGIATTKARPDPGAESTTRTEFTLPGLVVGTVAYMSPEQARGRALDKRSDIWSFGCVLYEALTGNRLFTGPTYSDTIAAILGDELKLDGLPESTAPAVRRLLERCLRQNTADRLRDIGDARIEIDDALAAPAEVARGMQTVQASRWRSGLLVLTGAAIVAVSSQAGFCMIEPGRRRYRRFGCCGLRTRSGWRNRPRFRRTANRWYLSRKMVVNVKSGCGCWPADRRSRLLKTMRITRDHGGLRILPASFISRQPQNRERPGQSGKYQLLEALPDGSRTLWDLVI